MKYQKLKRNLYTACVVANLFLIPSPVLWAEQSYAQSTRLSLELSNATISDVFASVEKNSEYRFFYSDAPVVTAVLLFSFPEHLVSVISQRV